MLKLYRKKQLTRKLHEWNFRKNVIKKKRIIITTTSDAEQCRSKVVEHQIKTAGLKQETIETSQSHVKIAYGMFSELSPPIEGMRNVHSHNGH
jgi:hypothetical protein